MKVLFVVNSFPKISETFIFNKINGLKDCGIDVSILCHSLKNDSAFFKSRLKKDINIMYSPIIQKNKLFLLFSLLTRLRVLKQIWSDLKGDEKSNTKNKIVKLLKLIPFYEEKYDVVHFEFSGIAVQYLDVLHLIKSRRFMSCRGAAEQIKPLYDDKRKEDLKNILQLIDRVHCVAIDMQKTVVKYGMDINKSFVNYPSIDTEFFKRKFPYNRKKNNNFFTVISIGRLHWKKGFNYALLGIKKLVEKGYNVKYEIIGSGNEIENLAFIINHLGLGGFVTIKGDLSSEEVRERLELADAFLLPSLSEGLSNAALEAMSMELPVISTKSGGMQEAIIHNENGLLVELFDYNSMAESIEYIMNNKQDSIDFGQKARKTIEERFNLKLQIKIFAEEYD